MGALKLSYYSNVISEIPLRENLYLGNVNVVLSDRKYAIDDDNDGTVDYYSPDILMTMDYYPFGQAIASRSTNSSSYKYVYNGMEKDDEVSGGGNSYTTEFRQNDPRLGRWMSLDPLMMQFPWMSPYVAFDNNPIYFVDPYGLASENGDDSGSDEGKKGDRGTRKPKDIPSEEESEMPSLKDIDGINVSVVIKPQTTNFWSKLKFVASKVVNTINAAAVFTKAIVSQKFDNFVTDLKRFESWLLKDVGVSPMTSNGTGDDMGTKIENDKNVHFIDVDWIKDLILPSDNKYKQYKKKESFRGVSEKFLKNYKKGEKHVKNMKKNIKIGGEDEGGIKEKIDTVVTINQWDRGHGYTRNRAFDTIVRKTDLHKINQNREWKNK